MPRKSKQPTAPAVNPPAIRATPTGRVTTDRPEQRFGGRLNVIVPPPSADDTWRTLHLDARTLDRVTPLKLTEYLVDLSPDVSRALFDFLRECNAGWELTALRPGSEDVDERAQAALDAMIATLGHLYGTPDVPINRLFLGLWLRGACFAEAVLDQSGRQFADLATPDPAIVRFKTVDDPIRGQVHQAGQMVSGQWVPFDRPTISYIPVDPLPGVPYGRPLVAPALFVALFLIGMLHDLRRVIAQQGYPRMDISVILDKLAAEMQSLGIPPAERQAYVNRIMDEVAGSYGSLDPDEMFLHTDAVVMNRPVGTVDTSSLGGIGPIIEALERQAVRALKTMPFLMAISESTTETQANRQYEQHAVSIRSMQHLVEIQLERVLGVSLQAQGIVAEVRMRFAENRASEEMRDEQVRQLKIANAGAAYAAGYMSQEQASEYAVNQPPDQEEPRNSGGPAPISPGAAENPDPSAGRAVDVVTLLQEHLSEQVRAERMAELRADDAMLAWGTTNGASD